MVYEPRFTITSKILGRLEAIQALHSRIQQTPIHLPDLVRIQKDILIRSAHGSSAIEGNPLTLKEAQTVIEGKNVPTATRRSIQEIRNTTAVMRFIQKRSDAQIIRNTDVLSIHKLLAKGDVLDRGPFGTYRTYGVRVGHHMPPHASEVAHYMTELLNWLNKKGNEWPALVSSAILHFRFEYIHPFGDGNGRCGRALAAWELYRRKFDSRHIFSIDEMLWENRKRYYAALHDAEKGPTQDLTGWILFTAEMLEGALGRTWERVRNFTHIQPRHSLHLTPRQETLLTLLRAGPLRPKELQSALEVTRGGLHFLMKPLLKAGFVKRQGGHKSGSYLISP